MQLLHLPTNDVLQLVSVLLKGPYALAQQIACHLAFVHLISEQFLSSIDRVNFVLSGQLGREFERYFCLSVLELLEQSRGDGEPIAAAQFLDFPCASERGAHHESLNAKVLVVIVDFSHRLHSGILSVVFIGLARLLLEPVKDAANEGGNEKEFAVSASHSLNLVEHQRHIAFDFVLQQGLPRLDALPSRRNLDQYAVRTHSRLLVKRDDPPSPLDGLVLVKGQPRINFR